MEKQIIGHKKSINFLNKSIEKNRISHAYLFEGPEQIGKKLVALKFAQAVQDENIISGKYSSRDIDPEEINKTNHDLIILSPEKGESITIAQIREFQGRLNLFPYSKKYKVAIIDNAEAMTVEAANSLLKTLEEPSLTTIIILITSSAEDILPTIKSRCQLVKFSASSKEELKDFLKNCRKSDEEIEQLINFSCHKAGIIMELLNDQDLFEQRKSDFKKFFQIINSGANEKMNYAEEISKESLERIKNILDLWIIVLRNNLLNCCEKGEPFSQKIVAVIKEIQKGQNLILKKKANTKLVLENLLLEM